MNSKFLITLKHIGYKRDAFPNAPEQLENTFFDLQRTINEYALKNDIALKHFVIYNLRQISKEKEHILEWHKQLSSKDRKILNTLPYTEVLEYDKDMEYYSGILTLIDTAISELRKYLKVFSPDVLIPKSEKQGKLSAILKSENNFIKGMGMDVVIKHFESLITDRNKANRHYLTEGQFVSFLKRGFLNDETQPKQSIDYMPGEKGRIIGLFYDFFVLARNTYYYPNKKTPFIELLTDCFEGWEAKSIEYFFKPNKVKEPLK